MRKLTLPNGIRLFTIPRNESPSVTVLVLFPVGSRYESPRVSGGSHYIEHLLFKGTEKRPTTLDISRALDSVGAEYNAFTAKDHTGYYIRVNASKIGLALDILSDMIMHSRFDQEEMEREKGVIIEEINMYDDNPMMIIEDYIEELVFGKGTLLGQNIAGTRKSVRAFRRSDILAYRKRHYHPRNCILAIAGKLPPHVTRMVSEAFGSFGPRQAAPAYARATVTQRRPRVAIHKKQTQQVHLALGFSGVSYTHRDLPALTVLTTILGGTMSSRLFVRIRERLGLAYAIRATVNVYQDTGVMYIYAGLDQSRINRALDEILLVLEEVIRDGTEEKELRMAKDYIAGKLKLEMESTEFLAAWYGKQEALLKTAESPHDRLQKIRAVTLRDIHRVAQATFRRNRANLVLIGPFGSAAPWTKRLATALE